MSSLEEGKDLTPNTKYKSRFSGLLYTMVEPEHLKWGEEEFGRVAKLLFKSIAICYFFNA